MAASVHCQCAPARRNLSGLVGDRVVAAPATGKQARKAGRGTGKQASQRAGHQSDRCIGLAVSPSEGIGFPARNLAARPTAAQPAPSKRPTFIKVSPLEGKIDDCIQWQSSGGQAGRPRQRAEPVEPPCRPRPRGPSGSAPVAPASVGSGSALATGRRLSGAIFYIDRVQVIV